MMRRTDLSKEMCQKSVTKSKLQQSSAPNPAIHKLEQSTSVIVGGVWGGGGGGGGVVHIDEEEVVARKWIPSKVWTKIDELRKLYWEYELLGLSYYEGPIIGKSCHKLPYVANICQKVPKVPKSSQKLPGRNRGSKVGGFHLKWNRNRRRRRCMRNTKVDSI